MQKYYIYGYDADPQPDDEDGDYYLVKDIDAILAEKNAQITDLNDRLDEKNKRIEALELQYRRKSLELMAALQEYKNEGLCDVDLAYRISQAASLMLAGEFIDGADKTVP